MLCSRYTLLPSGVLQINGVVVSDAGRYRCTAFIGEESRSSVQLELTVHLGKLE